MPNAPRNGIRVDASSAARLREAIEIRTAELVPKVHRETVASGRRIRAAAQAGWPYTGSTKFFRNTFGTQTKRLAKGSQVEIRSRSPFGTIFSYGAHGFAGKDVLMEALDAEYPRWQANLSAVLQQVISDNPDAR